MEMQMQHAQEPTKQRPAEQFRLTDDTRRRLNEIGVKYGRGTKTRIAEAGIRWMVGEIEKYGIKALYREE